MIDYIIVGSGLAGISFAEKAIEHKKEIRVIDSNLHSASRVAAGLYNPVVLKRFTPVWNAATQLDYLSAFFAKLEDKLNQKVDFSIPILRRFFSFEEQNNWYLASDKMGLIGFLSTILKSDKFIGIDSQFDFGEVKRTGYVDVPLLIEKYQRYLSHHNAYWNEHFDYEALIIHNDYVQYKDLVARHIIFAEGFQMLKNPFFSYLPMQGVKGELLIIKAPDLHLDVVVNAGVFILPIGNQLFKVGATYNWKDKTDRPTQEGRQELEEKLREIMTCEFEVVSHMAGVRPTVIDRRPLVGTHQKHHTIHILNGLGTRGVMIGPSMAKELFEHIEFHTPLSPEVNIARFKSS